MAGACRDIIRLWTSQSIPSIRPQQIRSHPDTHTQTIPYNVRQLITHSAIRIVLVVFRYDYNLHMPLPFYLVTGHQRLLTGINETSDQYHMSRVSMPPVAKRCVVAFVETGTIDRAIICNSERANYRMLYKNLVKLSLYLHILVSFIDFPPP